jgi:tripartite-type tricarboxylate transporter receptor subunit TctC
MLMSITRRLFAAAALAAALGAPVSSALAAYPERPITLIIPWGAGGGTDATGRILAQLMEKSLGQPINVVNRTGGGSVIGHTEIANAKPDGYTLGIITTELSMFPALNQGKIGYKDYTLIGLYNADPSAVVVRTDSPHKDLKSLADAIKADPGKLRAGGANQGGLNHLAYVGFVQALGAPANKAFWVPTEGAAPALQQLVSGVLDLAVVQLPEARALIDAGQLRPIAYLGNERDAAFPNVPTVKESLGIDFTAAGWRGLGGPKGLPEDVVKRLTEAMREAVASPEFKDLMAKRQFGVVFVSGQEFERYLGQREEAFTEALKAAGLAK